MLSSIVRLQGVKTPCIRCWNRSVAVNLRHLLAVWIVVLGPVEIHIKRLAQLINEEQNNREKEDVYSEEYLYTSSHLNVCS